MLHLWFQHDYKIICCEPLLKKRLHMLTGEPYDFPPTHATNIIERCACGAVRETLVHGKVTEEQLANKKIDQVIKEKVKE